MTTLIPSGTKYRAGHATHEAPDNLLHSKCFGVFILPRLLFSNKAKDK